MQTLASVAPISALLEALEVGEPLSHGALMVIPLLAPKERSPTGSRWSRRARPSPSRRSAPA